MYWYLTVHSYMYTVLSDLCGVPAVHTGYCLYVWYNIDIVTESTLIGLNVSCSHMSPDDRHVVLRGYHAGGADEFWCSSAGHPPPR